MLELQAGQTGQKIIVTLNELQTLDEPNYLFRFVHVLTKQVISFIRGQADDESGYPSRYNQFDINTAVTFLNKPVGEWHYTVYEQVGAVNTDPDLATGLLESGKMLLYPAAINEFAYDMYEEPTTYKTYQG